MAIKAQSTSQTIHFERIFRRDLGTNYSIPLPIHTANASKSVIDKNQVSIRLENDTQESNKSKEKRRIQCKTNVCYHDAIKMIKS